jgi:hypothetical protein
MCSLHQVLLAWSNQGEFNWQNILDGEAQGRDNLRNTVLSGSIILKCILNKYYFKK